jgi:hypothetical protein
MATDYDSEDIEREFSESWNRIEQFYNRNYPAVAPESLAVIDNPTKDRGIEIFSYFACRNELIKSIRDLITEMRKRGYDRQFRAGQSLDILVLSRSRNHGLRTGQANLGVMLNLAGGMIVSYHDQSTDMEINVERVELTPEVEELLARLLAQPID